MGAPRLKGEGQEDPREISGLNALVAWPLLGGVGAAKGEIRFPDGGRPGPCPCDRLQDWKRDVSICLNLTRFDFHVSMIDLFARTAEGSRKRVSQGRWSRVVLLKPKHLGFRN